MRINRIETSTERTINHKILRATLLIGGVTLIPRIFGMFKELVVASRFGRGDDVDTLLIALSVPLFLASVVCASLAPAFIPTFMQIHESEGKEAARRLLGTVSLGSQGLMIVLCVLIAVLAPYYLPFVAHGFSPQKLAQACHLTRLVSPYVFFFGMGVIWTAVLNATERFTLAAIVPIATPLVIITLLFMRSEWGISALAVGTVVGAFLEAALLAVALHRLGVDLRPRWGGIDQHLRKVASQYVPMMAGSMLAAASLLVDQAMAAMLPSGSVAALGYASKIIGVLTALGAASLSTSTLPYFSQMVARNQWSEIRHTLRTFTRLILWTTVPVTLGVCLLSEPIVQSIFQRGQFSVADSRVVASVQTMLILQLPFYAMSLVGGRLMCALRKNHFLMLVSLATLVLHVVLNLVFMRVWGIGGIALSTSLAFVVSWLLINAGVYRTLDQQEKAAMSVAAALETIPSTQATSTSLQEGV